MKSSAGLARHLVAERSRICASGIVSSSASQRTPFGYDLIQGADMSASFRLADTSCDRSMIVAIRGVGKRVSPQDDIALRGYIAQRCDAHHSNNEWSWAAW